MHPVLFTIDVGGRVVAVQAYGLFLGLATVVAVIIALVMSFRGGLPKRRTAVTLAVALSGAFLGARLLNAALNLQFYSDAPGRLFRPGLSGFSLYGGLVTACALAVAGAGALRVPRGKLLDATVPAVAGGLILARVGCFLNGCCFGRPTALPWGVSFPKGSLAWAYDAAYGSLNLFGGSSTVHPTQLYEIGGVIAACALAMWYGGSEPARPPGTTFLAFAGLFSLVRLGVHFLRAPVFATQAPAWFYPVLYSAIAVACLVIYTAGSVSSKRVRPGRLSART